jgi:hypothetical protein
MLEGRCSFLEDEHLYYIGPWEVPGTGPVMRAGGVLEDRFFTISGRSRGSVVHKLTQNLDLELITLDEVHTKLRGWVIAYAAFLRKHEPDYSMIETPVFNRELGFATVLDRTGTLIPDPREPEVRVPFVLNIKTGGHKHADDVQSAGEVLAYKNERDFDLARYTLYLKKTGKFKLERHPFEGDFDEFEDCLQDWRRLCHDPKRHPPLKDLRPLRSKRRLSAFRQRLLDSAKRGSRRSVGSTPSKTRTASAPSSSTTRSSTKPRSRRLSLVSSSRKR